MKYYAHSKENRPTADWQELQAHLENVASIATEFSGAFGASSWASILGAYHDMGKGTLPWQAYLRYANNISDQFSEYYEGHPKHAIVGAKHVFEASKQAGKLMSYCVAGHHGGLPNWMDSEASALESNLKKEHPDCKIPLPNLDFPGSLPISLENERCGFQLQFFIRMLFSCLVDADYLDTEAFMDKEKSQLRSSFQGISELKNHFWNNFGKLRSSVNKNSIVNKQRERVLEYCLKAASQQPGLFSLTVPTGGGKTLSSMAFALEHAVKHRKKRILYIIPFTSIIEQNAAVFRQMLGDYSVLEHHCNFIPDDTDWISRLAAENWDVPVVVSTNVQFFNSFFSNKPSKCRKLHNVTDSIIIFDEVQAIPVEKLRPCLEVIKELSLNYGVSSVLCTATQPAIEYSEHFKSGLVNVREIVQDVPHLFEILKRTEEAFIGKRTISEIAAKLADLNQVLCIVNTRQQALDLYNALPKSESDFHLSALMYPAHRSRKLNEIRQRLKNGLPCRVISTQLIEAGVDVDFPRVYRAVAGIDSIAQAAGRCNRNGLSQSPCKVSVFEFDNDSSHSYFRKAAQSASKLFDQYKGNLTSVECVKDYFLDYFWKNEQRMDDDEILTECLAAQTGDIQFKDIAKFQMIKTATEPIIIALEKEAAILADSLEYTNDKKNAYRRLQQYSVQIYPYQFQGIKEWLESSEPGIHILRSEELYSDETGLKCKPPEGDAFFG